jgi:cytidylate kinase
VGAALAARYGFLLLDTGVTYRAFTLAALERGVPAADEARCSALALELDFEVTGTSETRISVDGQDVTSRLREPAVEAAVSDYSAIAGVRDVMVALQRRVAERGPAVVVGRDIGTVVLPLAPVKLFLTASDESRAERRAAQAGEWGTAQDADGASRDIGQRDRIDSARATAPLKAADDAVVIDTTAMPIEAVIARAIEVIECARA